MATVFVASTIPAEAATVQATPVAHPAIATDGIAAPNPLYNCFPGWHTGPYGRCCAE
jgi:hypothetical protein